MTQAALETTFQMPAAPRTEEQIGVGPDLTLQLVLKTLHFGGHLTGAEVASRLGVRFSVVEPTLDFLKREHFCEISGGGTIGPSGYQYKLTEGGRSRAAAFLERNQYVGQMPVPLDQYLRYMRQFGETTAPAVTRESMKKAFSHLVLGDHILDQLGPALAAWHSLFVYGPPGNGKTVISQAIRNLIAGDIAIPYALYVDGHIIRLYDPVNHQRVGPAVELDGLQQVEPVDDRWIRCRRPVVTVGGELTLEGLELGYNTMTGLYRAPVQVLANGGVLVIDDFGRQHVSPRDLLNRWIVPLEGRQDYLTLHTGQKFPLPFEALVVFATNLKPSELVDEAFLRRIQYKVYAESPTTEEFVKIFENYSQLQNLNFDRAMVDALVETELRPRNVPLRGCHPRDLIDHALALAVYRGMPRALTLNLLSAACATYFVDDHEVPTV